MVGFKNKDLSIEVEEQADQLLVHITGEAAMPPTTDAMENYFNRVVARQPKCLVLDLSGLKMISSLGIGVLVALRRGMLRRGCKLTMRGVNGDILNVFKRCGLLSLFELHSAVE